MPEGAPIAPMLDLLEDITVVIEESLREKPRPGTSGVLPGNYVLSLKVKITSARKEKAFPLVDPRRFQVVLENGEKAPPHYKGVRDPALSTGYLKKGDLVLGWLCFQVPENAKQLMLKTGLTKKPLEVPPPKNAVDD
jgi:hypothetical protein